MIRSIRDHETQLIWDGEVSRRLPQDIQKRARIKLALLEVASQVEDLRVPPGNRLEALAGNRQGQYSIRINEQWRICFRWTEEGAEDVEIVDYH